jgi:HAMP domain-containing protein
MSDPPPTAPPVPARDVTRDVTRGVAREGAAGPGGRPAEARPAGAPARPVAGAWPALRRAVLGAPLAGKLLGANALLLLAGCLAYGATHRDVPRGPVLAAAAVLAASLAANVALVRLALRPLRDLEAAAERVWRGDLAARVPRSPLADAEVARVGRAFNLVLDGLVDDRARLRRLAADVVRAGDRERALIARELHDSPRQTLAAATYQLSALGRDAEEAPPAPSSPSAPRRARPRGRRARGDPPARPHVYPQGLDDLGLAAALHALAAPRPRHAPAVDTEVIVDAAAEALAADAVPAAAPRRSTAWPRRA